MAHRRYCWNPRQYPLRPYVLDFYRAELHLVVELDGGQHLAMRLCIGDAEHSRYLGRYGIRVLRFSNREVLAQMPEVLAEILRQAEMAAPHPNPLPGGQRELIV